MSGEKIIAMGDLHFPLTDMEAFHAVLDYIEYEKPVKVILMGDVLDLPQPSRWSAGTREEFAGGVVRDAVLARKRLIEPLRKVFKGPIEALEGNHDLRAQKYLVDRVPALPETGEAWSYKNLLQMDAYDIRLKPPWEVEQGLTFIHGHEGGVRLNQVAGMTALNAAKKTHSSLIMGHTHRLAAIPTTVGHGPLAHTVWGVETGHLIDVKKVDYMGDRVANWQQGFVKIVHGLPVPIYL